MTRISLLPVFAFVGLCAYNFDDRVRNSHRPHRTGNLITQFYSYCLSDGDRQRDGAGPQSPQNVRCFSPHCLHVYGTRTCPWAAETRFSAPHFAHLLSIRVLPRLIAMALCSIASFTKRSVSSRIACFDISLSLAFCKIGHRAGRRHGNEDVAIVRRPRGKS
jgi:hypothetical protein